ncbi:transcription factor MYB1R1 [Alnus glutinosa]|uniref:transcription factor MYB1R1 n=1 Tax=Alnus glutinosa TaxID=3517 RepID=UPI002D7752A3|nr:transcription factor MYB1R1 [Alnus glutinosa]
MSRACGGDAGGAGEFMLFGVRVVVDAMRKSVSMNNLSQYEQPQPEDPSKVNTNTNTNTNTSTKDDVAGAGYASADDAVPNSRSHRERERKRGVPWTEEEHKLFLLGLQKVGKGDWRGISRNFVKTRTPTQVASHAQKYFLRRSNLNRRRRRSSLFDITTDTVTAIPMELEEAGHHQDNASQSHPLPPSEACNFGGFPMMSAFPMTVGPAVVPVPIESPMENLNLRQGNVETNAASSSNLVHPIPVHTGHRASTMSDLNLNSSPLTLKLSLPSDQRESPSRHSAFQAMSSFNNNGDSIITVA